MALQRSCQDAKLEIEDSDALCAREAPPSRGVVGGGTGRSLWAAAANPAARRASPSPCSSPAPLPLTGAPLAPPYRPPLLRRPPLLLSPASPSSLPDSSSLLFLRLSSAGPRMTITSQARRTLPTFLSSANSGRSGNLDARLALVVCRAAREHKGKEAAGCAWVNAPRPPRQGK